MSSLQSLRIPVSCLEARAGKFGEIEVEGTHDAHDVVIDGGKVRKRKKGPSKQFREKFSHTPLSAEEKIPWGGKRLLVGTGAHGTFPAMDEVLAEAKRRGIEVIAAPTVEVCQLLEEVKKGRPTPFCIAPADRPERVVKSRRRTIWIADARRGDRKCFVLRADERLTAFVKLESAICERNKLS
jgi:hypothetical protein